jgi:hypothetical protein
VITDKSTEFHRSAQIRTQYYIPACDYAILTTGWGGESGHTADNALTLIGEAVFDEEINPTFDRTIVVILQYFKDSTIVDISKRGGQLVRISKKITE